MIYKAYHILSRRKEVKIIYYTRKVHLKNLTQNQVKILKSLAFASRDLYNDALRLVLDAVDSSKVLPSGFDLISSLRNTTNYQAVGYGFEGVIKQAVTNYKIYEAMRRTAQRQESMPFRYLKSERIYPPKLLTKPSSLYSEKVRVVNGKLQMVIPVHLLKQYGVLEFELPVEYQNLNVKRISISMNKSMTDYTIYLTCLDNSVAPSHSASSRKNHVISLDLGVSNFATIVSSGGDSFIIDGKYIKSIIQGFEKQSAKIRRKYHHNRHEIDRDWYSVRKRRENRIEDYLNKSVAYIIRYCITHDITHIVVGYNPEFTNKSNLGRENNQFFVQMPYSRFMNKLKFQAEKHGIRYKRQFEWYTSKASFLDNDEIPSWLTGKKQTFSGKRTSRGVYQSADGRTLNADVNAATNILRQCKLISEDEIQALQLKGLVQPVRINPHKLNRT